MCSLAFFSNSPFNRGCFSVTQIYRNSVTVHKFNLFELVGEKNTTFTNPSNKYADGPCGWGFKGADHSNHSVANVTSATTTVFGFPSPIWLPSCLIKAKP